MQENWYSGFPTRSDTIRPIQSQFWIYEGEELHYSCSKNKGADELSSYSLADLCLCFCIGKKLVY